MATYEELHGKRVEVFDSDPTLDSSYEGQVWFNSTEGVNKTVVAFSSVTSKPGITRGTTSSNQMGSFSGGSADAMAVFGGNPPAPGGSTTTEEFNGSGWTSGGAMNNSLFNRSGFGTLTAGVAYGGRVPPGTSNTTEHYNGSSWTAANAMPEAIRGGAGGGPQTAGIVFSGHANPTYPIASNKTKYYDGTNWTVQPGTMNTSRSNISGCGIQTAALAAAGEPNTAVVEEWNGSAWTTTTSLNTARVNQGPAMMQGTSSDAVILGGNPPYPSQARAIENWDGTSWTTNPVSLVSQGNSQAAGQGSSASSVSAFGGSAGSSLAEQFNKSVNTITAAAWSSGGSLNLARHNGGNSGTQTAGLFFGGKVYPNVFKNESEEYNGTSWSEGNNLGTARMIAGAGTQTAGLGFGGTNGAPGSTGVQALTEEYDGSSWSENGDMSTARMQGGGAGIQTAAYAAGGIGSPNALTDLHEQYNGSSWTTATAMNTVRSGMGSVGTTTASLVFGGYIPPSYTFATSSEEWNGSAWTAGGTLNTARVDIGGFGSQTDAIGFAGSTPPNSPSALAEGYDGTSFSTRPSMATSRTQFSPSGSYNSGSDGMAVGGSQAGNPMNAQTEEWTPETSAVTSKTLTTS